MQAPQEADHEYFYPRPPRGGRLECQVIAGRRHQFLSTPSARRATCGGLAEGDGGENFYPRPPRGGRRCRVIWVQSLLEFLSTPSARRATRRSGLLPRLPEISIHALREEGDTSAGPGRAEMSKFLSTPSARRATQPGRSPGKERMISIHALREEGDSKNGEKHLRFCFIIKRSAQIWKSLSKNIRKNSCDLHRMA